MTKARYNVNIDLSNKQGYISFTAVGQQIIMRTKMNAKHVVVVFFTIFAGI